MWVSVRVDEFMVHSVISHPPQHRLLARCRLQKEQRKLQERLRSVRSMREEAMRSHRGPEANRHNHHRLDNIGWDEVWRIVDRPDREDVQIDEYDDIPPLYNNFVFLFFIERIRFYFVIFRTCCRRQVELEDAEAIKKKFHNGRAQKDFVISRRLYGT